MRIREAVPAAMLLASVAIAAVALAGCADTPEPAAVSLPQRLVPCPPEDPRRLCGDEPPIDAASLEAVSASTVNSHRWGKGCWREVQAWRAGAAECRERLE